MTEDEARQKWCPFAMSAIDEREQVAFTANRTFAFDRNAQALMQPTATNCIASDCMMWRKGRREDDGYCGLAGTND